MKNSLFYAPIFLMGLCLLACTKAPPDPTLSITSPIENEVVSSRVTIQFKTTNFNSGHIHVWLDIPVGKRTDQNTETSLDPIKDSLVELPKSGKTLSVGWHVVTLEGGNSSHQPIPGTLDSVRFEVR